MKDMVDDAFCTQQSSDEYNIWILKTPRED
jgi:hypothetical protein